MTQPQVKINKSTPSEELVNQAAAEVAVTDARGRRIVLRKPGVLAQFRLIEAIGESAKNEVYVSMVLPLIFVAELDGEFVKPLMRKAQVEALISRLDDDGIAAVLEGVNQHFSPATPDQAKESLKN